MGWSQPPAGAREAGHSWTLTRHLLAEGRGGDSALQGVSGWEGGVGMAQVWAHSSRRRLRAELGVVWGRHRCGHTAQGDGSELSWEHVGLCVACGVCPPAATPSPLYLPLPPCWAASRFNLSTAWPIWELESRWYPQCPLWERINKLTSPS